MINYSLLTRGSEGLTREELVKKGDRLFHIHRNRNKLLRFFFGEHFPQSLRRTMSETDMVVLRASADVAVEEFLAEGYQDSSSVT